MAPITEISNSAAELDLPVEEMRALADSLLRRRRESRGIRATSLVHEAYIRMANGTRLVVRDEGHFLAIAARAMRFVLVDRARARQALKRGEGARGDITDVECLQSSSAPDGRMLAIDAALAKLTNLDRRRGEIVELKFFGGLDVDEVARALSISPATVKREWAAAKEWLYHEIGGGES